MTRVPRPLRSGLGGWPRLAVLVRTLGERYALGVLLVAALFVVIVGKADLKALNWLSVRAGDAIAPLMSALKEPAAGARVLADRFGTAMALGEENSRLRDENRRLLVWQAEAARLAVENESLRQILKMPTVEAAPLWTTARIVADAGGPFVRTLLIDAGADRGIQNGMAVVDESGFVGRIVGVGFRSARVLLLTDLNSKIPIITERTRDQAILEGTNDRQPELRFLPANPRLAVGERVLTSGRGGVLPPGLLIGEIASIRDQRVIIRPFVDWDRLDHVAVLRNAPVLPPPATPPGAMVQEAPPAPPLAPITGGPTAGLGGLPAPVPAGRPR